MHGGHLFMLATWLGPQRVTDKIGETGFTVCIICV